MSLYKHQNTGEVVKHVMTKGITVTLQNINTGEVRNTNLTTFKSKWVPVKEAHTDTGTPNTVESSPIESEPKTKAVEPSADEVKTDENKALTLSEVVRKLESLFSLLNGLYFENKLSAPVITIQSTPQAYGHCTSQKIWKSGVEGNGESYYEINIGAEYLNRASESTATTMLHEMIHLYCRENDLKETCQGPRYHNKFFKAEAEKRDLGIEYHRSRGYAITTPTTAFTEKLKAAGYVLEIPFARYTAVVEARSKVHRNKAYSYSCVACGQKFRSTSNLTLICGICELPMECAV